MLLSHTTGSLLYVDGTREGPVHQGHTCPPQENRRPCHKIGNMAYGLHPVQKHVRIDSPGKESERNQANRTACMCGIASRHNDRHTTPTQHKTRIHTHLLRSIHSYTYGGPMAYTSYTKKNCEHLRAHTERAHTAYIYIVYAVCRSHISTSSTYRGARYIHPMNNTRDKLFEHMGHVA